jgi:hypothetical protein
VPATGVGAVGGAGLGLLLNFIKNQTTGSEGGYDAAVGLGAAGGAGLGALSHYARNTFTKQSFAVGGPDPYTVVMMNTSLSSSEKQAIMQAMGRLSSPEIQDLKRLLATTAGAGVGAVIMRFLAGKGLISSAVGAIIGGVLGGGMVGSHRVNSLNQYY